ncbi:MAG: hypothetical protein ACW964_01675 [Candidatus Hodarchaeales archaeon]|jgi:hypothetical protein
MVKRSWIIIILALSIYITEFNVVLSEEMVTSDTEIEWSQTFGGIEEDQVFSLIQTVDGGFALLGRTYSMGAGKSDYLLVKTDPNGILQWNQTYGGEEKDWGESLVQTKDAGFVLIGTTYSFGAGESDYWLVKTDAEGITQWNHTYGDQYADYASIILNINDEGYLIAGRKRISDSYLWLLRADVNGTIIWNQSYIRENQRQFIHSIVQTADDGFGIVGNILSDQIESNILIIKLDNNGTMKGNRRLGDDSVFNSAYSIIQTIDGGFAIVGETGLSGFSNVMLLMKLDSLGNIQWNQTFHGMKIDQGVTLLQKTDGGFVLAGNTESYGAGKSDIWLVEANAEGEKIRENTFGGIEDDRIIALLQKSDGGFIIAGNTNSYSAGKTDMWLISTKKIWWEKETNSISSFDFLMIFIALTTFITISRRKIIPKSILKRR